MPCRDYYDDHPEAYFGPKLADKDAEINKLKAQVSFAESALCAVMKASDRQEADSFKAPVWAYINYAAAGITEAQLEEWRSRHQALDRKHRLDSVRSSLKGSIQNTNAVVAQVSSLIQQILNPNTLLDQTHAMTMLKAVSASGNVGMMTVMSATSSLTDEQLEAFQRVLDHMKGDK